MKKLPLFALMLGLGLFAVGCEAETETAPTTPATPDTTTTDGAATTTPAEGT